MAEPTPEAVDYSAERLANDLTDSSRKGETIEQWWDSAHRSNHKGWLTGTPGAVTWQRLQIADRIKHGAVILEIGVGLGICTQALRDAGCVVHANDISRVALNRVRAFATVWESDQLSVLPPGLFDVVFSHLVAQHMSSPDLARQIAAIVPALNADGVFALQYASPIVLDASRLVPETLSSAKDGSILRMPIQIEAMVEAAGARVVLHKRIELYPEFNSAHEIVHVARN